MGIELAWWGYRITMTIVLHIINTLIASLGVILSAGIIIYLHGRKKNDDLISGQLKEIAHMIAEKKSSPFLNESAIPVSTWTPPKADKPRVIRRSEFDESQIERPLGERNFP